MENSFRWCELECNLKFKNTFQASNRSQERHILWKVRLSRGAPTHVAVRPELLMSDFCLIQKLKRRRVLRHCFHLSTRTDHLFHLQSLHIDIPFCSIKCQRWVGCRLSGRADTRKSVRPPCGLVRYRHISVVCLSSSCHHCACHHHHHCTVVGITWQSEYSMPHVRALWS